MTQDVIALTPRMPDPKALLAGLHAGGPDLRVDRAGDGAVVRLCADSGQTLLSLEAPRYLQVPREVERLLGKGVWNESPVWWTEARASSAAAEAARLAGSVAGRLAAVLGGAVWPPGAGHTEVVPDLAGLRGDTAPPGVDVLTARAAVVIQGRPVVAATTWLADVARNAARTGRELQLVTPPDTRLTFPFHTLLDGLPSRWVVRNLECGYYDGLSGAVLDWHDGRFAPATTDDGAPRIAEAFRQPAGAEGERQLILSLRTIHPADDRLTLGGAPELAWRVLTGAPPAGWSTAEPVNVPWSRRQLTELARGRAQRSLPTWVVVVGGSDRPSIATVRVSHTAVGVEERTTIALGYGSGHDVPLDLVPELAASLATDHGLATMLVQLRSARADLSTPARHQPPSAPLSFTLGPDAVTGLGLTGTALADTVPMHLGPAAGPVLHYVLGDGGGPSGWERLRKIQARMGRLSRTTDSIADTGF
ncbi:DUF6177 family protein [Streptomyces drozdowiczii]|uniref:DUF6177 family protein n=1 Tax=Streptomyces drozdowiczii TaxID=202862 RepID=A0ABY6PSX3_9ACTN|nr:DUF6177 family protein [Streptomyces drozdowiczii]MCX0245226.1 DUF6177 family protein [Streptomyces drozdowiczii]UZK55105.1 DUF6177 family protein [Streptomyces drozdowiczii]